MPARPASVSSDQLRRPPSACKNNARPGPYKGSWEGHESQTPPSAHGTSRPFLPPRSETPNKSCSSHHPKSQSDRAPAGPPATHASCQEADAAHACADEPRDASLSPANPSSKGKVFVHV